MVTYLGSKGGHYTLGRELGCGGEGKIYEVGGGDVAKIYHAPNASRDAKVRVMAAMTIPSEVYDLVAWPKEILTDTQTGMTVGFIMPRLNALYALDTFTEYPRIEVKPQPAGYLTYYLIAFNTASVVRKLHDAGLIIGDFNGDNIGYTSEGRPVFYDADSFHVPGHPCVVCRPEYVPEWIRPALKVGLGNYHGETFTEKTDDWALAAHLFELLMNGAHPYASAPTGSEDALSLREAINAGACTFFSNVQGYAPPPYAPSIDILPPEIQYLFRRAFVGFKGDVPTAAEWEIALSKIINDGFAAHCSMKHHEIPVTANVVDCPLCTAYANYCRIAGISVKRTKSKSNALGTPSPPSQPSSQSMQPLNTSTASSAQTVKKRTRGTKGNIVSRFRKTLNGALGKIRKSRVARWIKKLFRVLWGTSIVANAIILGLLIIACIGASGADSIYLHSAILAALLRNILSIATLKTENASLGILSSIITLAIANYIPEVVALDTYSLFAWMLFGTSILAWFFGVRNP